MAEHATIRDGLLALEHSAHRVIPIVSNQFAMIAAVTESDIRRGLLAGVPLDAPLLSLASRDYVSTRRVEAPDGMPGRRLEQIPANALTGSLRGCPRLGVVAGRAKRPNWAVVMAGGRGRRLAPLTDHLPKPMIPIAGRPILEWLVLHLVECGIEHVFLSVHYLSEAIINYFGDGSAFSCHIHYLKENKPLGTGGSLTLLPEPPTAPILVMNGDLIATPDLAAMFEQHGRTDAKITIGTHRYAQQIPYGCMQIDGNQIVEFREKPTIEHLVNTGIYILEPELLTAIPRDTEYQITELFTQCLDQGDNLHAFEIVDDWLDIGHHEQLSRAHEVFP